MNNNFFLVTTPNGKVTEYFNNRKSACEFIADEFAMACVFRLPNESERLVEYLMTNNETPNQYEFKYIIKELNFNTEYNSTNFMYIVQVSERDTQFVEKQNIFIFKEFKNAQNKFYELSNSDIDEFGYDKNMVFEIKDNKSYHRWNKYIGENICYYKINIIQMAETKNGFVESVV